MLILSQGSCRLPGQPGRSLQGEGLLLRVSGKASGRAGEKGGL